jgi:hypothetical protein
MAAGLEHEPRSDPVKLGQKMRALFNHIGTLKLRAAARD